MNHCKEHLLSLQLLVLRSTLLLRNEIWSISYFNVSKEKISNIQKIDNTYRLSPSTNPAIPPTVMAAAFGRTVHSSFT